MNADQERTTGETPVGDMLLDDVDVEIAVVLGRNRLTLDKALVLGENSLVDLDRAVGEAVDVLINGKLFARGEVVTVNENFGVRLTEVVGEAGPVLPQG